MGTPDCCIPHSIVKTRGKQQKQIKKTLCTACQQTWDKFCVQTEYAIMDLYIYVHFYDNQCFIKTGLKTKSTCILYTDL